MTKDYARRRPNKKKPSKSSASVKISLIVLIMCVFVGFVLWMWQGVHQNSPVKEAAKPKLPPVQTAVPVVEQEKKPSVDYQFYTLLPNMKVENLNAKDDEMPPGTAQGYWLQVAVYYAEKDAAATIERLQLQGILPEIAQRVSKSGKTLYTVVIGPYASKEEALHQQQALRSQGIDNVIFHVETKVDQ